MGMSEIPRLPLEWTLRPGETHLVPEWERISNIRCSIIIATSGIDDYEGTLLKIEQDQIYPQKDGGEYALIAEEWAEYRNLEECLGIKTKGLCGIYRVEFDIHECRDGDYGEYSYPEATNMSFTPIPWPPDIGQHVNEDGKKVLEEYGIK
jgi:hypothetical protein